MNQGTRQRLAGAIVLGCLAIIFIPILLDGEGLESPEFELNTPSPPPLPEVSEQEPVRPDFMTDSADTNINADLADEAETPPRPEEESRESSSGERDDSAPRLDAEGLPQGWSVRLGTFGDQGNAESLVSRLRAAGHKAYSRMVSAANGPLTAVYVGPVLTRSEADSLQEALSDAFELDGLVVEFTIEE